jgi:trans-2,3-dihydro-3-hydroxyanthranilate isomerase
VSSPRAHRYVVLDVFTATPLEGNALAVFPDGEAFPEQDMLRMARELNLSETAFVLAPERGGDARVRIFTPAVELPFAGHPVLGTALVIARERGLASVTLETIAGLVPVRLVLEGDGGSELAGRGSMEQPIPSWQAYGREADVLAALGVGHSGLPVELYENGPAFAYVELDGEEAVAALAPDMRALADLGSVGIVCFAGAGKRWKVRMFAPAAGVPEDPATGSAAGPLVVHLARHGRVAFGEEIEIHQGAEIARPSLLRARVTGTGERIERVEVGGSAVIAARGEFLL